MTYLQMKKSWSLLVVKSFGSVAGIFLIAWHAAGLRGCFVEVGGLRGAEERRNCAHGRIVPAGDVT